VFLEHLEVQTIKMNWINMSLLCVVNNAIKFSILNQYGLITEAIYPIHVANHAHADRRCMQDSANLYACLKKSLTTEAHKDLMVADKSLYMVALRLPNNQICPNFMMECSF
jgi:hypothetical protein